MSFRASLLAALVGASLLASAEQAAENAAAAAVEMPITAEIYAVCFQGKDPREAVTDLMTRELRSE